ncbi:hypothetical protein BS78_K074000 [Paspalum vaginatum]|uniref:Uncharacterized protein n=1 Tax=Paspalum vaginatum TaxID=158149 RepID=A0A9W8CCQ6_9POAL|nr:hypothetical protein BS78_K074000 [Paspalum vaginatum]
MHPAADGDTSLMRVRANAAYTGRSARRMRPVGSGDTGWRARRILPVGGSRHGAKVGRIRPRPLQAGPAGASRPRRPTCRSWSSLRTSPAVTDAAASSPG